MGGHLQIGWPEITWANVNWVSLVNDLEEEHSRKDWKGQPWAEIELEKVWGAEARCEGCEEGHDGNEMNRLDQASHSNVRNQNSIFGEMEVTWGLLAGRELSWLSL